jgi:hypothetical protein
MSEDFVGENGMDIRSLQKPLKDQYRRDLQEKTEQYCVVLQTMLRPPKIDARWTSK